MPTDPPYLAFLALTIAALVLPHADRRLRAALGLPAVLLGAASLRIAAGEPAPRTFLAVSAAMLLIGIAPVVREAAASIREAGTKRLPAIAALALAATALVLTIEPVRAGGLVRTLLVSAGLVLLASVMWVAGGLMRIGSTARWLIARLAPAHILVLGVDRATSRSWSYLYYAGLLAAVAAPYWTLTFAGSIVAVIAFDALERQRGVLRRLSPAWLVVPALIGAWWLVATVSAPGNQTISALTDAPFSPPAEVVLAGMVGFAALALLRPWRFHVDPSPALLGFVAAALMLKIVARAAPLGVIYWQPLAFLFAVIAGWAGVATRQVQPAVIAVTLAALWTGAEGMPGAVLLALLQPVVARWPGRASGAAVAAAIALAAAPMLRAEAVFTVLLAAAATALLASLADVAPPR